MKIKGTPKSIVVVKGYDYIYFDEDGYAEIPDKSLARKVKKALKGKKI